ncbi:MAG: hypothetical protein EBZ62_05865 [Sphingobacteriia bacterium]|nr:hypothetical protein [Sphingobacteriia bacterium]
MVWFGKGPIGRQMVVGVGLNHALLGCLRAIARPSMGGTGPEFPANRNLNLGRFKDAPVLVLVFSHYACPAHHLYQPKINALRPMWQRLQGQALWIFPHTLSPTMQPYAEAILAQDLRGETFAAYGIRKIPHIVVIKKSAAPHPKRRCSTKHRSTWKICYSGAVDADPENLASPMRADLAEALRDLEFSDYVRIPKTNLHGCPYPYTP